MANLNKVMLIGRLTRDPEVRSFPSGGKVAHFGFAVNNKRKNAATGEWEDEPVFLDVEVFNRGDTNKLADRVEQTLRKGQQIFIEGKLKLDQPIAHYLEDFAVPVKGRAVTVSDLLHHVSGLADYTSDDWDGSDEAFATLTTEAHLKWLNGTKARRAPANSRGFGDWAAWGWVGPA